MNEETNTQNTSIGQNTSAGEEKISSKFDVKKLEEFVAQVDSMKKQEPCVKRSLGNHFRSRFVNCYNELSKY